MDIDIAKFQVVVMLEALGVNSLVDFQFLNSNANEGQAEQSQLPERISHKTVVNSH
jgi:hypothetical protein